MTKHLKKGIALFLAAAMVFSTPLAVNTARAEGEDDTTVTETPTNPTEAETIAGTGWWGGPNENSSKYYVADGGSAEIYIANTAGSTGVVIESSVGTGDDAKFFDVNMQGTDAWGALIAEQSGSTDVGFPAGGVVKVELSREGSALKYTATDVSTDETIADWDFILDCENEEVLGFYIMATDGTFRVGPTVASVSSLIKDVTATFTEDGKVSISYTEEMVADSVEIKVDGVVIDGTEFTPTESKTYVITVTATKEGFSDDEETVSIGVSVGEDGSLTHDEELIGNLKATKAADAYSITYEKLIEDATYTMEVTGGGKTITADEDGNVKFADLTSGTEYTVTVTAAKEGYVTKTATTTFTYTEEKVQDAAADVKRTMINKTLGKTDYSTAFWSQFEAFQIEDNKKYTFVFENHSKGDSNWQNFVLAFANQANFVNETRGDKYVEYAVARADNYEWIMKDGATLANTSLSGKAVTFTNSITDPAAGSEESWAEWKSIIKDSDVTMSVIRSGAEIKVEATIVSQADKNKKIDWTMSLNAANADGSAPNPLYMAFTVDACYLNLKYVDEQASNVKLEQSKESTEKPKGAQPKSMMISGISAKAGAKKVTGSVNAPNATVEVKVGKAAYKKATVSGKKFTLATSKLKIGTKVTVKASAEGYRTATKSVTVKGTMKLSGVKAKKGSTKVTGKVSVKKATVKVKVGKKKYKKAKVSGKKFTFKCAKLKKGTKVKIQVTKKNYTTVTKTVKVK